VKTQVIKLDLDDDRTSACDKMAWAKSARILIVIPLGSRISTQLDLQIMNRHAAHLGARLAFVSRSEQIKATGGLLDLPVFPTISTAQRGSWNAITLALPHHEKNPRIKLSNPRKGIQSAAGWRWINSPVSRIAFFSLGLVAIISMLFLFYPRASVTLIPRTILQSVTIRVRGSSEQNTVNVAGFIPIETRVSTSGGTQAIATSGSTLFPVGYSSGIVQLTNLSTSVIGIPVGTILKTLDEQPISFETVEDGVVPAGIGESAQISVKAVAPGSTGNIPAGITFTVNGESGINLDVTSLRDFRGGSESPVAFASPDDQAQLKATLLSQLVEECNLNLASAFPPGAISFPALSDYKIIDEFYFPSTDEPADQLTLTMDIECSGAYATQESINELARLVLDANLPVGFDPQNDDIQIQHGNILMVGGFPVWEMTSTRFLLANIDERLLGYQMAGKRPEDAVNELYANLPLERYPELVINPDWWPRLPLVPFRISIITIGNQVGE
jgi:hypothetical protein